MALRIGFAVLTCHVEEECRPDPYPHPNFDPIPHGSVPLCFRANESLEELALASDHALHISVEATLVRRMGLLPSVNEDA